MEKWIWLSRILSWTILSCLFGLLIHSNEMKWHVAGKEAFLKFESASFDRFMSNPHSALYWVAMLIIFGFIVWLIYEFLAAGFEILFRMLKFSKTE
jgi:hypothetical protein